MDNKYINGINCTDYDLYIHLCNLRMEKIYEFRRKKYDKKIIKKGGIKC